jgi:hypothetical protein
VQADEPGATDPSKPSDGAHRVQVRDETYAISDDRWTRIFPDAAAKEKTAGAAASVETPTTAARPGVPLALIIAGGAIVAIGAGAAAAWVLLGQGPHHAASAPVQVVAALPIPPAPVAPPAPTPAPPPAQTAAPIVRPTAAPPPTIPFDRPHHRMRDDGERGDGAHHDRVERHEAEDMGPAEAPRPPPPPPPAKKGDAVSRFFGHLFGHHPPADAGSSSGGEKPGGNP